MQTSLLSTPIQVITSIRLQQDPDKLLLIASTRLPQRAGCPAQLQVLIPKLDGYFTGTGKLAPVQAVPASLLCLCHKSGGPWQNCMLLPAYWQTYVCCQVAQLTG